MMEPLALTIAEASKLAGPKRDKAYREIKAGRLRAVKRGRNTLILMEDLKSYLASLPAIRPSSTLAGAPQDSVRSPRAQREKRT